MKFSMFKPSRVDESKLDFIAERSKEAGYLDRKSWEQQDEKTYQQSKSLWSEVEPFLKELAGNNEDLYKKLMKVARLSYSMGTVQWEIDQKHQGYQTIRHNNQALLNVEVNWLKDNGYISKEKTLAV